MKPKQFQLRTLGCLTLDGADVEHADIGKRPRKLALLAVLALSRQSPTRERLVEMFWGGEDEDRARHSLSDALSHIRRVLGRGSIATRARVVELDVAGVLAIDAVEFESACDAKDYPRAIAIYGGPFLGDFHVGGSPSFDEWASRARARYARMFSLACEAHCTALLRESRFDDAVVTSARWLGEEHASATAATVLLQAGGSSTDAAIQRQALDEYERWAERGARDAGVTPDARLAGMASDLARTLAQRARAEIATLPSLPEEGLAVVSSTTTVAPNSITDTAKSLSFAGGEAPDLDLPRSDVASHSMASATTTRGSMWRWGIAAGAVAAVLLGLIIYSRASARALPLKPLIALVDFRADAADTSLAWLSEGLKQMIAADIARVPMTEVIPPSLTRDSPAGSGVPALDARDAALSLVRKLHATLTVSARLSRNEGSYVVAMVMRPTDGPAAEQRYTVTGKDILVVADQMAARILSIAAAGAAGPRLSDVETSNTEAFRHFVRGKQFLDDGRNDDAGKELDLAIAADSLFTSAIVARLHSQDGNVYRRVKPLFERVHARLTEWDRLSESVYDAFRSGDNARAEVLAQELEQRFPRDPRAITQAADVYFSHGRFAEAASAYQRLLALDSLGLEGGTGACAPCGALSGLASVRQIMGDAAGARIAARRLIELRPGSPGAWVAYGAILSLNGSVDEALVALHRGHELLGDSALDVPTARALVSARRYAKAEAMARPYLHSRSDAAARDILGTVYRERGEFRAAAAILDFTEWEGLELVRASSLAAAGDVAGAERIFRSRFFNPSRISAGGAFVGARAGDEARAFAWEHALEADAIWERADTTILGALADSVRIVGARSYYARDWQLHHHIRGLIAVRANHMDDAERELSAAKARFPGWTRTNLLLARVQIAMAHPERAVLSLRRAYREPLDAMGRYAPRSDLDFEMARAFRALGQPDSARAYAGYVRLAWAHADPETARRLALLP